MHQGRRPVKSLGSGTVAEGKASQQGFTLVEVLIAMAITAFVSVLSYQTLSTAITGIESARDASERLHEINRAFTVMSRDIRFLTLFQFHQALRQSRDGLSEIFRCAGDPKGHGGRHHRKLMVALMTTQERRCLKIKLT